MVTYSPVHDFAVDFSSEPVTDGELLREGVSEESASEEHVTHLQVATHKLKTAPEWLE